MNQRFCNHEMPNAIGVQTLSGGEYGPCVFNQCAPGYSVFRFLKSNGDIFPICGKYFYLDPNYPRPIPTASSYYYRFANLDTGERIDYSCAQSRNALNYFVFTNAVPPYFHSYPECDTKSIFTLGAIPKIFSDSLKCDSPVFPSADYLAGKGSHVEGNQCVPDVNTCTDEKGSGTKTWNGEIYTPCSYKACNLGFKLSGSKCEIDMALRAKVISVINQVLLD